MRPTGAAPSAPSALAASGTHSRVAVATAHGVDPQQRAVVARRACDVARLAACARRRRVQRIERAGRRRVVLAAERERVAGPVYTPRVQMLLDRVVRELAHRAKRDHAELGQPLPRPQQARRQCAFGVAPCGDVADHGGRRQARQSPFCGVSDKRPP